MIDVDRAEAAFWSTWIRNRNVDAASASDGAVAVAGGYALCLTGTTIEYALGIGTTRPLVAEDCAVMREFYRRRALPARAELHEAAWARDGDVLRANGFAEDGPPLAVLVGPTAGATTGPDGRGSVHVRTTTDRRAWADLIVRAWASEPPPGDADRVLRSIQATAVAAHGLFIAALDGVDVGAGAATLMREYVMLSGGAVLASARRRGVHRALLAARLAFGRERGAATAAVTVTPDAAAERSAEAAGFRRSHLRRRLTSS